MFPKWRSKHVKGPPRHAERPSKDFGGRAVRPSQSGWLHARGLPQTVPPLTVPTPLSNPFIDTGPPPFALLNSLSACHRFRSCQNKMQWSAKFFLQIWRYSDCRTDTHWPGRSAMVSSRRGFGLGALGSGGGGLRMLFTHSCASAQPSPGGGGL